MQEPFAEWMYHYLRLTDSKRLASLIDMPHADEAIKPEWWKDASFTNGLEQHYLSAKPDKTEGE